MSARVAALYVPLTFVGAISVGLFSTWLRPLEHEAISSRQTLERTLEPSAGNPTGMVWIPAGRFVMGARDEMPDEQPEHWVELDGFWMDETEVTNEQFAKFVGATGYKTIAERTPMREDFIGQVERIDLIPAENLVAGSLCFNPNFDRTQISRNEPLWAYQVWSYVRGADWRHPAGPDSSINELMDHPVVHVAWSDAVAYCQWAKKRLPTEAEWECAARGALVGAKYPWGNELNPGGLWRNNIWQGQFPDENTNADGFKGTAPVRYFPPNGFGLYAMSGNVWEWCEDYYRPEFYGVSPRQNPHGPSDSFDPNEPGLEKRVMRGGSFMCNANYCLGYRVSARMKGEPSSGAHHTGFRCVR